MVTNDEMFRKCVEVESIITLMVMRGVTNNRDLVEVIREKYNPVTTWEQEILSEVIICAKQAVLN